jgi:hypothetical protein
MCIKNANKEILLPDKSRMIRAIKTVGILNLDLVVPVRMHKITIL